VILIRLRCSNWLMGERFIMTHVDLFGSSRAIDWNAYYLKAHPDALSWLADQGIHCNVSVLHANVNGRSDAVGMRFSFTHKEEALLFKLTWGGK